MACLMFGLAALAPVYGCPPTRRPTRVVPVGRRCSWAEAPTFARWPADRTKRMVRVTNEA